MAQASPDYSASTGAAIGKNMERLILALKEALPVFDRKIFDAALQEIKDRPRAAVHYLFDQFGTQDQAVRAFVCRLLRETGAPDVLDNLNAIIFDADYSEADKVLANDILDHLGQPVDPDVFAMSVEDPEPMAAALPSRVSALLAKGDVNGAVEKARTLPQAERSILIADAILKTPDHALPFLTALAKDGEDNAMAVSAAIASEKFEAGLQLLNDLQETAGRDLQKLIKRALFDLRGEGVEIPQPKPQAEPRTKAEATDAEALYRAYMSEFSPAGVGLVIVARQRPDRRLKVFSVLISLWKRGIQQAGLRNSMSRSSFDRFVRDQGRGRMTLSESNLEECRRLVARGMRVAKEFGTPLPFDFGMGKAMLGDVDGEAEALETPFLCSQCGKPLDIETVEKIRASAPYENIPVETRCADCRKA